MKTLTIKRDMVENLESDESKLAFANSVIALLTDREQPSGPIIESLREGLTDNLPEPLDGSPEFDSSNMATAQFMRFSMVRAGFFPVTLNCGYADYKYKHLDDFSRDELIDLFGDVGLKKVRSKGKKDFVVFLEYIQKVLDWYLMQSRGQVGP